MQQIAEQTGNSVGLTLAHAVQGTSFLFRGELTQSMRHFDAALSFYRAADFSASFLDPKIQMQIAMGWLSWHLRMGDQGRAEIHEGIVLSERSKKGADLADSLAYASMMYMDFREPGNVQEVAERLFRVAREGQLGSYLAISSVCRGWVMTKQGAIEEGIALIREGLDLAEAHNNRLYDPPLFAALSEVQARAGQLEEALSTIEQAFSAVGEQQIHLPGLLWRRGEVHFLRGNETKAADDFSEAVAVAKRIGSKAYELRATTSLARLLAKQDKRDEARTMLAEICNWFTEGFDTADLKDAKALLDELGA
jgi:tetratricopeptide (TPR) repeat protein